MRLQDQFKSDEQWARETRKSLQRDGLLHLGILVTIVTITALYFAVTYGEHIDYLFTK